MGRRACRANAPAAPTSPTAPGPPPVSPVTAFAPMRTSPGNACLYNLRDAGEIPPDFPGI